jgi:hypothetical protein
MPGSIETKLPDKDAQGQPRKPHVSPAALPAFNPEAVSSDDSTVEAWVLNALGKEHLIDVPLNVARKIVIVDALDYHITMNEKLALIAYGLWFESISLRSIQQHLGISGDSRVNPLLNLVLDNAQSARSKISLGDCSTEVAVVEDILKKVDPLAADGKDRERLKAVAEEVLGLQGDGLSGEEIIKRRFSIQERVQLRLRAEARSKPPVV